MDCTTMEKTNSKKWIVNTWTFVLSSSHAGPVVLQGWELRCRQSLWRVWGERWGKQ